MLIWNHVQQDSVNAHGFCPTDVNLALEQSTEAARFGVHRRTQEPNLVDEFAELLPSGD
jgi:hypothetical protein